MAIPTTTPRLSANDARILNALFDPETLPSSVAQAKDASAIETTLPPHPTISSSQLATLEQQQNELVRRVGSADSSSDVATIDAVIAELDEVIRGYPDYPSAYVNRAMLRRMKLETTIKSAMDLQNKAGIFSLEPSNIGPLFTDLSLAITSSLPVSSSPKASVSEYQARMLRTAYTHRAYLYLKASESGASWKGKEGSELEELASRDFAEAARFGDEKAREMSVRTNPYKKMCGAIVKNALSEERREAGLGGL
jgi:hypothetical protein